MQRKNAVLTRISVTGLVTVLIFGLLFWDYFHGGVPVHHLLMQKDLPGISNWWGGLLLPVLSWILVGKTERRLANQYSLHQQGRNNNAKAIGLFLLGMILGLLIVVSFVNEYNFFLENIIYVFLLLSLLVPIYYAEFILGFILGMSYTFGAILPTIFIGILASLGFLLYRFIRPLLLRAKDSFAK